MNIFLDSADFSQMCEWDLWVDGFTTNPVLARASDDPVTDLDTWVRAVAPKPISLEVTSETLVEMDREARTLGALAPHVWVKVPCLTPTGITTAPLIRALTRDGITVNATCILTIDHALIAARAGAQVISVFAGRIADTGRDPEPIMARIKGELDPGQSLLWASAREVFNIVQAQRCGADIITLSPALLAKRASCWGRDLKDYGLATVQEFANA